MVFARSGGFCEVMATGCHLNADAIVSRVARRDDGDASTLFAVCQECAITLQRMDSHLVRRLGYHLDSAPEAATTPFLWRQKHRLILDTRGALRHPGSASTASEPPELVPSEQSHVADRRPDRVVVPRRIARSQLAGGAGA